jgi:hypothetical protein
MWFQNKIVFMGKIIVLMETDMNWPFSPLFPAANGNIFTFWLNNVKPYYIKSPVF